MNTPNYELYHFSLYARHYMFRNKIFPKKEIPQWSKDLMAEQYKIIHERLTITDIIMQEKYVIWGWVWEYSDVTIEIIERYKDEVQWGPLSYRDKPLREEVMIKYIDKLWWDCILFKDYDLSDNIMALLHMKGII